MIDREARNSAVSLLRRVKCEGITNWVLEDSWPKSESDPALGCIMRWLWSLYDDGKESVMADVINTEMLGVLERAIVFLEADHEYELADLTESELANETKVWGREWDPRCRSPDYPEWPFPPGFDLGATESSVDRSQKSRSAD